MDNNSFLELLYRNSESELQDFLLSKGKGPKVICPIMFIKQEDGNQEKENKSWNKDQN